MGTQSVFLSQVRQIISLIFTLDTDDFVLVRNIMNNN